MPRKCGAVWDYFVVTESTEHEQRRATCNFCSHTFATNPTRMRAHILEGCKFIDAEARERVRIEHKEMMEKEAERAAAAASQGVPVPKKPAKRRRETVPQANAAARSVNHMLGNVLGYDPGTNPDKTAIITGGTGGIGKAAAQALAEDGWNLLLCYCSNETRAKSVQDSLRHEFPTVKVEICGGDLTEDGTVEKIFQLVELEFKNVTALIHLAGRPPTAINGRPFSLAENMPKSAEEWKVFKEWDFFHELYVKRFVQLSEHAIPLMPNYYGRILTISAPGINGLGSVAPYYDLPGMGRASMDFLTRQYAKKLAPRGITANVLVPGYVYNSEWEAMKPFVGGEEGLNTLMRQRTPMKRWGTSEEVGGLIRYICSPMAGFLTGNVINIDGGFHLM